MSHLTPTQAARYVRDDLSKGLPQFAISDFRFEEELSAAAGVETVVWEADARLVDKFLGAEPGEHPLVIRGITLVKQVDDGVPVFRRYIDWMDLLNALGLNGVMRPARLGSAK